MKLVELFWLKILKPFVNRLKFWFSPPWEDLEEAKKWRSAGWIISALAYRWYSAGWREPKSALKWSKYWSSIPEQALKWYQAGWTDPRVARRWYNGGWKDKDPAEALEWFKAGWKKPKKAIEWYGYDPVEAYILHRLRIKNPNELAKWKEKGIKEHYQIIAWALQGFTLDVAAEWIKEGWEDPELARKWFESLPAKQYTPRIAFECASRGMTPEDGAKWFLFFVDVDKNGKIIGEWYAAGWRNPLVARKWFSAFGNYPKTAFYYYKTYGYVETALHKEKKLNLSEKLDADKKELRKVKINELLDTKLLNELLGKSDKNFMDESLNKEKQLEGIDLDKDQ